MINIIQSQKINIGIQLLRFLLCFWIVIMHCSNINASHIKYLYKGFHVPTFFFLSFYFYYPVISKKNIDKIVSRFQRLLLPYIFWPLFRIIFKIKIADEKHSLKNFFLQILLGFPIQCVFWFQFNLIFLSLFFAIILFSSNKNGQKILLFIGLLFYYLHLTGEVYNLLIGYSYLFRNSIGGLLEMMPLAINGYNLNSINIFLILNPYLIIVNIFLFCLVFILFKHDIFLKKPGFRYPDVSLNILSSIILFLYFGTLSFEKIKKNKYIIIFIRYITQFTGGIYYTHTIIRDSLKKYSYPFVKRNL